MKITKSIHEKPEDVLDNVSRWLQEKDVEHYRVVDGGVVAILRSLEEWPEDPFFRLAGCTIKFKAKGIGIRTMLDVEVTNPEKDMVSSLSNVKKNTGLIELACQDLWEYLETDDVKDKYSPKSWARVRYLKKVPNDRGRAEECMKELIKKFGSDNVIAELESYFGRPVNADLSRYIIAYHELVIGGKEKGIDL